MTRQRRRPVTSGIAVLCALLDAAALRLDIGAAAGRHALIRGPMAMGIRATSSILRYWNTCWVGRFLGISWVLRTFRRGMQPPVR